jgi:Holliday junction resolvasome RuvABC endonuclease subunit
LSIDSSLRRFRDSDTSPRINRVSGKPAARKVIQNIVAFDPSLTDTGWVWVLEGRPTASGNIRTEKQGKGGFEDTFRRVEEIYEASRTVLRMIMALRQRSILAHEMPAVQKGQMSFRTDASLVASIVIRRAAFDLGFKPSEVVQVQAQSAKLSLTGKRNATKAEVREAIEKVFPGFAPNEAIRDALCIALKAPETLAKSSKAS